MSADSSASATGGGELTWRPIESAPRDGSTVLLYAASWEDTWGIQTGAFHNERWITAEGEVEDDAEEQVFCGDDEFEFEHVGPTHWMPLPAPPALSERPS